MHRSTHSLFGLLALSLVLSTVTPASILCTNDKGVVKCVLRGDNPAIEVDLQVDASAPEFIGMANFNSIGAPEPVRAFDLAGLIEDAKTAGKREKKLEDCPRCANPRDCVFKFFKEPPQKYAGKKLNNFYIACNQFYTKPLQEITKCDQFSQISYRDFSQMSALAENTEIFGTISSEMCGDDAKTWFVAGPDAEVPIKFYHSENVEEEAPFYYRAMGALVKSRSDFQMKKVGEMMGFTGLRTNWLTSLAVEQIKATGKNALVANLNIEPAEAELCTARFSREFFDSGKNPNMSYQPLEAFLKAHSAGRIRIRI